MKRKRLLSITFLFFMHFNTAHGEPTVFSYLWGTQSNGTGSLVYSGPAIDYIEGKVHSLNSGTMSVVRNKCNPETGSDLVQYRADDSWIFFPASIDINGHKSLKISTPSGYNQYIFSSYNVLVRNGEIKEDMQLGQCSNIGATYPINYVYPEVSFQLNTANLTAGRYQGTIPLKLAYAEYFSEFKDSISKYGLLDVFGYTSDVNIPYDITITNKCSFSSTNVSLEHGHLSADEADGHSVTKSININCDAATSLKVSVASKSNPKPLTSSSERVSVGLGNGWISEVKIGSSDLSDIHTQNRVIYVLSGGVSLPITSTLKKHGDVSAGSLSGNLVITFTLD